jgi:polysaccharide biosynthesis transport protein
MNESQNPFLEEEINFHEYLDVIMRRRWIIISFTVILCTLALIRGFLMKPVYEGTIRILIEKQAPKVVKMDEVTPMDFSAREYYQTQYKILQSRSIAEKVDASLKGYVPWSPWKGYVKGKDLDEMSRRNRVKALLGVIKVKPVPNTQLVEVGAEDLDPITAALIANLWAQSYMSYTLDAKFDATREASAWLKKKINESRDHLRTAEKKLQNYRKENNIMLEDADDDRYFGPSMLQDLIKRRSELEIEIAEKSEHFKGMHPEIIGLTSELASVNLKIDGEKDKKVYSGDIGIQYGMLKQDVYTARQIYDSLLQRAKETDVTGELQTTNIRVVDRATVPEKPSKPRKKRDLLLALIIGLMGGGALAFFMEALDQSVKTPEDVKNKVKLPCLGTIAVPAAEEDKHVKNELIISLKPRSVISEAYRGIRTSIVFTAVEHKRKTILITSSSPQEGKTTVASNLAIAMAQSGEKTILLDADMRKPRLENVFGIKMQHGLSDILAGKDIFKDAVHKTDIQNLDIIACGSIPPNPSELLGSRKIQEFLAFLEEKYDRVIIDSSPVLAVTDSVVLSGKVDGVILVVKAGYTHKNAAIKVKEILETVKTASILGVVLNMVETGKSGGHYYYYSQYYGKHHGKYYGDNEA